GTPAEPERAPPPPIEPTPDPPAHRSTSAKGRVHRAPKIAERPAAPVDRGSRGIEVQVDTEPSGAAVFSSAGKVGVTPLDVVMAGDRPTAHKMVLDGYREHTVNWTPRLKSRSILVRLERAP